MIYSSRNLLYFPHTSPLVLTGSVQTFPGFNSSFVFLSLRSSNSLMLILSIVFAVCLEHQISGFMESNVAFLNMEDGMIMIDSGGLYPSYPGYPDEPFQNRAELPDDPREQILCLLQALSREFLPGYNRKSKQQCS